MYSGTSFCVDMFSFFLGIYQWMNFLNHLINIHLAFCESFNLIFKVDVSFYIATSKVEESQFFHIVHSLINFLLLGDRIMYVCHGWNLRSLPDVLCSEVGFLEGDWIKRVLCSSVD